jgi:hypothetical protein
VIDAVAANFINSSGGSISINQVCGQCSESDPCACYFSGITVSGVQDPKIQTNCTTCYNYNPVTGDSTEVQCPGASQKNNNKYFFFIGLGIVCVLLIGYLLWKIYRR